MNKKTLITIGGVVLIIAVVSCFALTLYPMIVHEYGQGTYDVGSDIPEGSYEITGKDISISGPSDYHYSSDSRVSLHDGLTVTVPENTTIKLIENDANE